MDSTSTDINYNGFKISVGIMSLVYNNVTYYHFEWEI